MTEPNRKPELPIDALLPELLASLRAAPNLVLTAEPGAGKTTRVPPALLSAVRGEVIVLEPRRIAARMAARRVAWEMGEEAGATVGYQVRFEEAVSSRTRLRFVTEGILIRRMMADPELRGVECVVLDEFHERHLDTDLALALLRRLQMTSRPELKIVVMSATLDAAPVAEFLGRCAVLHAPGRAFPLTMEHAPYSPEPLHVQVRVAAEKLAREKHAGHTLVFLPGAAEIRRAMRECQGVAQAAGWVALPLHGDLSPAEQDRAVNPSKQPKLIFSTNVAESSLTIDGVTAVIDSGLARMAGHSPWTGLPVLAVGRVSQASAKQRAGRAGRTAAGRVLRLYSEADLLQRPAQDPPEIVRGDLSQLALQLRGMGLSLQDEDGLQWLTPAPEAAVGQAEELLDRLHATGDDAKKLAALPLPPRLGRAVLEAVERGVGAAACLAAALLTSGVRGEGVDLLTAMDTPLDANVARTAAQLRRTLRIADARHPHTADDALLMALLAGFPDRVARKRAGRELLLSNGIAAELAAEAPGYEFMVVLDAEDRREKPLPLVRTVARIEPDWLIDPFPERVREVPVLTWNRAAQRVDAMTLLKYDELLLQEWRDTKPDAEAAAAMLAEQAMAAGLAKFADVDAVDNLRARVRFAGLGEVDAEAELRAIAATLSVFSFAELKKAATGLGPLLEARLDGQRLRELAPATLKLKAGRPMAVHYEDGKPPWIAARMQDFFGTKDGPRIGPEGTPVVMHLLGPNNRPLQQTADLAGFWQRLYPELRRSLMRRYPKHHWPEKPV